jgi:hypothetical protein
MKSLKKLFSSSKPTNTQKKKTASSSRSKQRKQVEDDDDEEEEDDEEDDNSNVDEEDDEMIAEIFENERWHSSGWSFKNLLKSQGEWHYQSSSGGSNSFPSPVLADGWAYRGQW